MTKQQVQVGQVYEPQDAVGPSPRRVKVVGLEPVNGPGTDYAYVEEIAGNRVGRKARIALHRLIKPWKYKLVDGTIGGEEVGGEGGGA